MTADRTTEFEIEYLMRRGYATNNLFSRLISWSGEAYLIRPDGSGLDPAVRSQAEVDGVAQHMALPLFPERAYLNACGHRGVWELSEESVSELARTQLAAKEPRKVVVAFGDITNDDHDGVQRTLERENVKLLIASSILWEPPASRTFNTEVFVSMGRRGRAYTMVEMASHIAKLGELTCEIWCMPDLSNHDRECLVYAAKLHELPIREGYLPA